ncbi:MAG: hypothetical protein EKK48_13565 [Candidatus Melainabacteria bacterium]|nr:MAG: hypothetical protein EKK48_13565 [Candidatus Melainabacteria bacterium]
MKIGSIHKIGVSMAMSALSCMPAFADTTLQSFLCDARGSVTIQNGTSHDKKFVIPGINKIAVLVDASAEGPVGINYEFNPPIPMQFVTWYYKEARGSNALRGITARYCISKTDGSDVKSVDIDGGQYDRGGQVGDGWSSTIQDTRAFPNYVYNGNAVLSKLTFIFKDKNNANNITLGRLVINQNAISPTLITETGPCSLKEKCTKQAD